MEVTEEINSEGILIVGTILIFSLMVLLIVFFVLYQRRLYRQQEAMRLAEQQYQKELLRAADQTREKEQQRIAQELHDGVGAMLSTTRMYVQQVQRLAGKEKANEFAERADKLLGETLTGVRRIAQDMKPVILETMGLKEALLNLAEKVTETGQVTVTSELEALPTLPAEDSLRMYRMVQEMLSNALKYAQAKELTLSARTEGDQTVLTFTDDGIGFDPNQVKGPDGQGGMGLRTLESRASPLEVTININSAPGKGTTLTLQFPTPKPTPA
ncbi:MAG TPA: hypothetical protein DCR93_02370 [Cytophagales bacterium]|nr:hypothetical protein [Cytophagales bacterium]